MGEWVVRWEGVGILGLLGMGMLGWGVQGVDGRVE